nr:cytochrome C oxidase copper chaperone 1-like [Ipomoea batatas]
MVSKNQVRLRQVIGRCPPELEQPPFSSSEATSASKLHLNASFFSMSKLKKIYHLPLPEVQNTVVNGGAVSQWSVERGGRQPAGRGGGAGWSRWSGGGVMLVEVGVGTRQRSWSERRRFRRNRCSLQPSPPLLVHQTLVAAPESSVQPSPVACSPSAFATSRVQDIFTMGGLPIESSSCAIALPKPPEDKSPGTSVGPDSKPKKKICCACPETKKLRDECIVKHGEFACKKWIEAHLKCLRTEGFNV